MILQSGMHRQAGRQAGRQAILCPYFAHGCAYAVRKRIGGGKY